MIWFILIGAVSIVWLIVIYIKCWEDRTTEGKLIFGALSIFFMTIGYGILIIVVALPLNYAFGHIFQRYDNVTEIKLVNLSSDSQLSGSFFLGVGNIDDEQCYIYYTQEDDNSFMFHKTEVTPDTKLFEQNRDDGILRIHKAQFVDKNAKWFSVMPSGAYYYEFIVPIGSVRRSYNVP